MMRRYRPSSWVWIMGCALLLLVLASCGSGTTGGSNTGNTVVIKVATELPVTGADASTGKPAEDGARLAVDQANANKTIPGVTLQFVTNDDVGVGGIHDPQKGANNVTAMIGDALVAGIVGPYNSNVARAEMPIANNAPLAIISPSNTNPCLTQNSVVADCNGVNDKLAVYRPTGKVTYFRVVTTDNLQGPAGARYLYTTLHYKKAYVVDDTETYGVGLAKYFMQEWSRLGGVVIDHKSVKNTTSYLDLLTTIAANKPDVVYFAGNYSTGGTLLRQQMQQFAALKDTAFAGGDGIQDDSFASVVGTGGGPVYATVPAVDPNTVPSAKSFIQAYRTRYGDLSAYSAPAYEAMNILIQAIKTALNTTHAPKDSNDAAQGKVFRQTVIDAIQHISYNGVLGHTSFDTNGDTTNKNLTIYEVTMAPNKASWKAVTTQVVQ